MASTHIPVHVMRKKVNGTYVRNDSGTKYSAIRVYIARKVTGNQAVRKS